MHIRVRIYNDVHVNITFFFLLQTDTYMKKMRSSIHNLYKMIQHLEASIDDGYHVGYDRS